MPDTLPDGFEPTTSGLQDHITDHRATVASHYTQYAYKLYDRCTDVVTLW